MKVFNARLSNNNKLKVNFRFERSDSNRADRETLRNQSRPALALVIRNNRHQSYFLFTERVSALHPCGRIKRDGSWHQASQEEGEDSNHGQSTVLELLVLHLVGNIRKH